LNFEPTLNLSLFLLPCFLQVFIIIDQYHSGLVKNRPFVFIFGELYSTNGTCFPCSAISTLHLIPTQQKLSPQPILTKVFPQFFVAFFTHVCKPTMTSLTKIFLAREVEWSKAEKYKDFCSIYGTMPSALEFHQ